MIQAAVAVPDHASLQPWHFIQVSNEGRSELADIFVESRRRRQPDAGTDILTSERAKAHEPPMLICVCARLQPEHSRVPISEQFATVGAAIQNLLLSAHTLGYGGIMLSGERVREPLLRQAFRLAQNEVVVGFISLGTIAIPPRSARRPEPEDVLSVWHGCQSGA